MDGAIEDWLVGDGGNVTPASSRLHALDDAVAFFGPNPFSRSVPGLGNGLRIGRRDGAGSVRIATDGSIELGNESSSKARVAREGDSTTVDNGTDPAMIGWMRAVDAGMRGLAGPSAGGQVAYTSGIAAAGLGSSPTSIGGRVSSGSDDVSSS